MSEIWVYRPENIILIGKLGNMLLNHWMLGYSILRIWASNCLEDLNSPQVETRNRSMAKWRMSMAMFDC